MTWTNFKARAKTLWSTINGYLKQATSVVSDMLGTFSPQWLKAEGKWKSYRPGKKAIAVCILALLGVAAWKFSVDVTRLAFGSYRAASVYGQGREVTRADIAAAVSKLPAEEDVSNLQAQIDALRAELASIDKTPAKITTGSLPAKKPVRKAPARKSSYSVSDPSTWHLP